MLSLSSNSAWYTKTKTRKQKNTNCRGMVGIRSCGLDNSTVYFTGQVKLLYFANCFFLDEHLRIEINKITKRFDIISLHHVGEEVKQKCLVNMLRKSVKLFHMNK